MKIDLTPEETALLTQCLVIVTQATTKPDLAPLDIAASLERSAALLRKLNQDVERSKSKQ